MSELQSAHLKRIVANIIFIVGPVLSGAEAVKGSLPAWGAAVITGLSVALKSYQSLLDLQAPAK